MMKYKLFLLMINIFYNINSPMQKIIILAVSICYSMFLYSMFMKNSWMFIITMILFISGLLTLFMYMTSINQKFIKMNFNFMKFTFVFITTLILSNLENVNDTNMYQTNEKYMINFFSEWNYSVSMILMIFLETISNINSPFRSNSNFDK